MWIHKDTPHLDFVLPQVVAGLDDEFLVSLDFDAAFMAMLIWHGFLPMATNQDVGRGKKEDLFLPKIHKNRCVLKKNKFNLEQNFRVINYLARCEETIRTTTLKITSYNF